MQKILIFAALLTGYCMAKPIWHLIDPKCVEISNATCPNENVTFWLYTKQSRYSPLKLDPLNLKKEDFQSRRPLYILIHGFNGNRNNAFNNYIRGALLDMEDAYVITVDYGPLVPYPCYFVAIQNLPLASTCLADLINTMVDLDLVENDDIHMIGFSLGAQVAGQTASKLKQRLKRITGLDPAKPLFLTADTNEVLDKTDADFVDIIHTEPYFTGILSGIGHVDFYPNLGLVQPGCLLHEKSAIVCNHGRAFQYYAESIYNDCKAFWAKSCSSVVGYYFGSCSNQFNRMGHHVYQDIQGSFFLQTSDSWPFALGAPKKIS